MSTLTLGNADISLTAASQQVFQAPTLSQSTILKATATNIDTVAHWVTVWRVGNGGSPTDATIMGADKQAIGPGATIVIPISGQTLIDEQSVYAATDVDNMVNFSISLATST
jgi:hypothetical protein